MSDVTNYEAMLSELLEERANIDRMIVWIQRKLGKGDSVAPSLPLSAYPPPSDRPDMRFHRVATDQFFKMSVPEAIRAFLNIQKRPQTAREITEALKVGGLSYRAKDLYQTVFPTLQRMKEKGEVDKLANGEWGLSEWYGSGRRTEADSNGKREPD